jgi:amidase
MYEAGKRVLGSEYLLAKAALQQASRGVAKFFENHDIWLTSTLGTPPMKIGEFDIDERDITKGFLPLFDYVPFTALQNVTGQPAISLPLHWNKDGVPIGAHFVAPFGDELTLLRLAMELERAAPWSHRYAQVKV